MAGAAVAPAIAIAAGKSAVAVEAARPASVPARPQTAGDTQTPSGLPKLTTSGKVGGDFMVDVIKALDIDYVASCPGSTFRGLQESIINYAMNSKPEFIFCLHEEASVAMAHGYSKIAGKPMAAMVHGVVGTQHAAMAIYNCFADQAPAVILAGNVGAGTARRPGVEWAHSAHDQAVIVRDYVKWDDQSANLQDFAEGLVRAYDLAVTAPMGPVFVTIDSEQQEEEIEPDAAVHRSCASAHQPDRRPNAIAETRSCSSTPKIPSSSSAATPAAKRARGSGLSSPRRSRRR